MANDQPVNNVMHFIDPFHSLIIYYAIYTVFDCPETI